MSDVPKTDAACRAMKGHADTWVPRYVCEELERAAATEKALADQLARALRKLLRLHDTGEWIGKAPDEASRKALKNWKEARK